MISAATWVVVAEFSELIGTLLMAVPVFADFRLRKARGSVFRKPTTPDEEELRSSLLKSFTDALLAFDPWQRRLFASGLLGLVFAALIKIGVHFFN